MRINRNTVLVGRKVVLVPYRKQHVPRYHEWMKDPLIQEQTASEALSLEEEYEMQQSWAVDEDKLTFIILARPDAASALEVSVERLVSECKMVGDVNVFFNVRHEDEDEADEEGSATAKAGEVKNAQGEIFDAECEIMIAEHDYRRKGIAREALQMMFSFVTASPTPTGTTITEIPSNSGEAAAAPQSMEGSHCTLPIPSSWLTCKISLTNTPSIKLFESLGFTKQKVSEVWQEVEMRYTNKDPGFLTQCHESIRQVLFWPEE